MRSPNERGPGRTPTLEDASHHAASSGHHPTTDQGQATLDAYAEHLAANARNTGVARSLEVHDPDTEIARAELEYLIASGEPFSTDELPHPERRGVMGALVLRAVKAGRIESIGRTRSKRLQAHGRWIEVWRGVQP